MSIENLWTVLPKDFDVDPLEYAEYIFVRSFMFELLSVIILTFLKSAINMFLSGNENMIFQTSSKFITF